MISMGFLFFLYLLYFKIDFSAT